MLFWIGILVGGLFAWLGFKIGFYQTWALLFNVVVAVYLAIFLGPIIADVIPGVSEAPFSTVLAVTAMGIAAFLVLQCLSYTFVTGQFNVSIPALVDTLGSVLLGFLGGFLVWSFVALLLCMTPISQNRFMKGIGFCGESEQTVKGNVYWWCNLVHKVAAADEDSPTPRDTVAELLHKTMGRPMDRGEPNQPGDANEPPGGGSPPSVG
jgi:hypothetical protein